MIPNLELFGNTYAIYPFLALIGIFVSGIYLCKSTKRHGKSDNDMIVFLLVSTIGVFIGMHILYGLTNINKIIMLFKDLSVIKSFKDFMSALLVIFGGSVFYGGLLGGILAGYIFLKKSKWDINLWSDLAAPGIPLFHFFGRIGCFLGGCCFGQECSIGFTYKYSPIPGANGIVRFPIQLVEAGFNLLLFFILDHLLKHNKAKGRLLCVYLLSYAPMRFIIEFFRGDTIRGIWFGLSTSQWISLLIILFTSIYLFIQSKKAAKI